jgi:SAM-dependent methyltransferase
VSEVWERQRRTFENTAEAYDRFRPKYPERLLEDLRAYAQLRPDDRILEIGCATGQATRPIAAWGNPVLALEPAPGMVEFAERTLATFANVEIRTTTFEDWPVEPEAFGLIFTAQAFHWLDPDSKYRRCADALRTGGTLALIWNTQVTPPEDLPFFETVQEVYLRHAPEIAHKGEFRTKVDDDRELREMERSGLFTDTEVRRYPWAWTLDRESYVGLMSSHSPHAALDADARERLLAGIGELIDASFGGHVTETYVAELFVGRKK